MEGPMLSFIIPAYNEESSLLDTLYSINNYVPDALSYEVIVADNGSTDGTVEIARNMGAIVVSDGSATVAGLRNMAVACSKGQVYVFLDADVQLTEQWSRAIPHVYSAIIDNPWQLTGSRCGVPHDAGWIEACWFKPLSRKQGNYINSGHLIVSSALFARIGGFDINMQTGEDYQFSVAAKAVNADIHPEPSLHVVHTGYPKTFLQFIRREIWHGKGDCIPFYAIFKSKVALSSMIISALTIISIFALTMSFAVFGIAGLMLSTAACIGMAVFKHSVTKPKCLAAVTILYYAYFFSRSISCIAMIFPVSRARHHR